MSLSLAKWTKLTAFCLVLSLGACANVPPPAYVPPKTGATATVNVMLHARFGPATLYFASAYSDGFFTGPVFTVQQIQNLPHPSSSQFSLQVPANHPIQFVYIEPLINTLQDCAFAFTFSTASAHTYYLDVGDSGRPDATDNAGKFAQWLFPLVDKDCGAQVKEIGSDGVGVVVPLQIADKHQSFVLIAH